MARRRRTKFGARLKALRTAQGLSQTALAKELWGKGASSSKVSHWEGKPDTLPRDVGDLIRIANHFSVTLDYLVGRVDDPLGAWSPASEPGVELDALGGDEHGQAQESG